MKTMKCNQLGGACELEFRAETFDEIAQMSQEHGMEMFKKQDAAHLEAMGKMQAMMATPGSMQEWMASKRQAFEDLPQD